MRKSAFMLARRRFTSLALLGAVLPGTALSLRKAQAAQAVKVAALFTGSVTQGNWDPPGYAAFKKMAAKYGFQSSYVENATYETAPSILRQLASSGVEMIICHSSGYSAAIEEVAKDYPKTQFVLYSYASSTGGLPNYSAWSVNWDEYGFIGGAAAAAASKSKYVGLVNGEEIPSTKRATEFYQKGAQYIAPDVKFDAVYVGSFSDIAKAKEIATDLIMRGVDVLIPDADTADAGTQQAADENEALTLGAYIDQSKQYPDTVVTSTMLNFDLAFDQMGEYFTGNKLNGQIYTMNLANNGWSLATPFCHVSPDVQAKVMDLVAKVTKNQVNFE